MNPARGGEAVVIASHSLILRAARSHSKYLARNYGVLSFQGIKPLICSFVKPTFFRAAP